MSGPTDLFAQAEELLQASKEALDTLLVDGLDGSPERYFVSPGEPALDCCDQLTVHVNALTEAPTAPGGLAVGTRIARINLVTFVVTIARCVPQRDDFQPQEPSILELAAQQQDADAWALWNHLWALWKADLLFTLCGKVFWDGMRALIPQGGCSGWTLTIRAELDGYDDVSS